MREILFRGKRVDNGEWVYGWYVHTKRHHCIITGCIDDGHVVYGHYANDVAMYVVDSATVGQYTGLQDKNCNRIFEGDILRVMYKNCYGNDICHTVTLYDMTDRLDMERISESEAVIIGNIHDNPELLEGVQ